MAGDSLRCSILIEFCFCPKYGHYGVKDQFAILRVLQEAINRGLIESFYRDQ